MEIWLDKKYCILSGKYQYILGEKCNSRMLHIGFFTSLDGLLREYIARRCRSNKSIKTMQELIDYHNSVLAGLNKALQPLEIKVIRKNEATAQNKKADNFV